MILDGIVNSKMEELARRKESMPLSQLAKHLRAQRLDFAQAIKGDDIKLIAEVKKASPSRGVLCPDLDPIELSLTYAQNGAAAISVLTEKKYFQGNIEHLLDISEELETSDVPLLRKDFIFDPYQIYETCAYRAHGLLLIAAILRDKELAELLALSHDLGMKCLVEVHNEEELERALASDAQIIGINNRDLDTFAVDLETTKRLRPLIPPDRIVVSESGIRTREDIEKLKGWGVDAVLVGEVLVTANDVAQKMRELL